VCNEWHCDRQNAMSDSTITRSLTHKYLWWEYTASQPAQPHSTVIMYHCLLCIGLATLASGVDWEGGG